MIREPQHNSSWDASNSDICLEVLIRRMTVAFMVANCLNGWLQNWEATFKLPMWRVLVLSRPCWGTVWNSASWHWPNQYQETCYQIKSTILSQCLRPCLVPVLFTSWEADFVSQNCWYRSHFEKIWCATGR